MAADYITSATQTMTLVRSIAAHLAAEPNLPAAKNLTRGEVDAWIRALNTGIHGRVIDMLALPVLECLLYMRGRNLAWTVKHLERAPCEKFQPVIVNPWIPVDVPSNRTHLPWILGDRHQAIEISDDAEDPVDPDEQETIVEDQDVDVEEDFSLPDGEGTQLDRSPQDIDKDNDSTLTTQQSLNKQGATVLLSTAAAEIAMDTTSPSTHDDDDIAMQDASEQNDSAAISSENEKPSQPTSLASEDESDHDESGRTLWCVCNGEDTGTSMTQCHNHNDPACKGKWYHHTCVDLTRPPPKHMDWYCDDCRKKLKLGVYSNGCVDKTRTVDKKRRR